MPDQFPPSEFGGKINDKGIQPPPHAPTASERLTMVYRTGTESGVGSLDTDVWGGLRPEARQRAIRAAEGALAKGQTWETLTVVGEVTISEIAAADPKDEV